MCVSPEMMTEWAVSSRGDVTSLIASHPHPLREGAGFVLPSKLVIGLACYSVQERAVPVLPLLGDPAAFSPP